MLSCAVCLGTDYVQRYASADRICNGSSSKASDSGSEDKMDEEEDPSDGFLSSSDDEDES